MTRVSLIKKGLFMKKVIDVYGVSTKKMIVYGLIALFLLVTVLSSFQTIKSGEVGLKVRFGKIVDSSLNEGLNLKIPYIEEIKKVNIKVQKSEISVESSTKDMQTIDTTIAVNYRVDAKKASNLYRTVGNNYETTVALYAPHVSAMGRCTLFMPCVIPSSAPIRTEAPSVLRGIHHPYKTPHTSRRHAASRPPSFPPPA